MPWEKRVYGYPFQCTHCWSWAMEECIGHPSPWSCTDVPSPYWFCQVGQIVQLLEVRLPGKVGVMHVPPQIRRNQGVGAAGPSQAATAAQCRVGQCCLGCHPLLAWARQRRQQQLVLVPGDFSGCRVEEELRGGRGQCGNWAVPCMTSEGKES